MGFSNVMWVFKGVKGRKVFWVWGISSSKAEKYPPQQSTLSDLMVIWGVYYDYIMGELYDLANIETSHNSQTRIAFFSWCKWCCFFIPFFGVRKSLENSWSLQSSRLLGWSRFALHDGCGRVQLKPAPDEKKWLIKLADIVFKPNGGCWSFRLVALSEV